MTERQSEGTQVGVQNIDGGRHSYSSRIELSGIPFRITDTEQVTALPCAVNADADRSSAGRTRWINELGDMTRS
jgi:hypothetical protein